MMPKSCPNVPSEILNPKETWKNKKAYDIQAKELANSFKENFAKFETYANDEILAGAPASE